LFRHTDIPFPGEEPIVATRITKTVVDDLDGTAAAGTYRFALGDVAFEIDLSDDNLQRLRDALAPFMAAGRRLPKTAKANRHAAAGSGASADTKRMRRWWADNQHRDDLPPYRAHGPMPQQVRDAHRQAMTPQPRPGADIPQSGRTT
jgi:hypothetical protein